MSEPTSYDAWVLTIHPPAGQRTPAQAATFAKIAWLRQSWEAIARVPRWGMVTADGAWIPITSTPDLSHSGASYALAHQFTYGPGGTITSGRRTKAIRLNRRDREAFGDVIGHHQAEVVIDDGLADVRQEFPLFPWPAAVGTEPPTPETVHAADAHAHSTPEMSANGSRRVPRGVRLGEHLWNWLDDAAEARNCSVNAIIEGFIVKGIEESGGLPRTVTSETGQVQQGAIDDYNTSD